MGGMVGGVNRPGNSTDLQCPFKLMQDMLKPHLSLTHSALVECNPTVQVGGVKVRGMHAYMGGVRVCDGRGGECRWRACSAAPGKRWRACSSAPYEPSYPLEGRNGWESDTCRG